MANLSLFGPKQANLAATLAASGRRHFLDSAKEAIKKRTPRGILRVWLN